MRFAPEVVAAARRIIDGDDSSCAAAALEGALHTHCPYGDDLDEVIEDLYFVLAMYSPAEGRPYADHAELCDAIRRAGVYTSEEE